MKKLTLIYTIVVSFITVINLQAQFNPDTLRARVSRIVQKYVDSNRAAVMVGVIRKEGSSSPVEYKYSFGHINSDTASPRPDSLTIFQLGSVTKSFTATILSMLIQQGGPLNVNDLVEDHLPLNIVKAPVYVNPGGDTVRMIILDLATHYAALPDDPITPVNDTTTYQMMYSYLNNHTLSRTPGQCYLYSNLGVSLLGVVVTNTLGNIIDSLFIQKICDPLGMPDTRITLTPEQMSRRAQGYKFGTTEGPFHKSSWPAFYAAGGLYTTVLDFLKYLKFQMGLSGLGMQSVLDSAQRIRRVTNDTCLNPNATGRIGLVWQMNILNEQIDSTFYFTWKDGGTEAFSSYICFANDSSKDLKTGVVVLSNHLTPACDKLGVQILRYLNSDTTTVGIDPVSQNIPENFKLFQNYPNPFNPNTVIRYSLSENRFTTLKVFDALGKEVAVLVNENLNAGTYEVDFSGANLPSGIYFYKLISGDFTETKKMFLIK
ncbi:MAG: serine hydrolase [Ignavibacteria bacterium]|nr:serine hydrolase [Ignavibacteria bacterium]